MNDLGPAYLRQLGRTLSEAGECVREVGLGWRRESARPERVQLGGGKGQMKSTGGS